MNGGYDEGYEKCPCFWGREPGSYVKRLELYLPTIANLNALDAGCGEGKNAVYLGERGATVRAVDCSSIAISNARATWADSKQVEWEIATVQDIVLPCLAYDIIVAYGLFHCLKDAGEISRVVRGFQSATRPLGLHVICAFNNRSQDLSAHPGFRPCLLAHEQYLGMYVGWDILEHSDTDLTETHPHNNIEHTHSMTRLIARRPS